MVSCSDCSAPRREATSSETDPRAAPLRPAEPLATTRANAPRRPALDPAAIHCIQPDLEIPASAECAEGRPYPECRWQLPRAEFFEVWRNTSHDHRWARPGLVSLVLAAAFEYHRRWPGEHVTVGDLDAAGPRHQTHDRGIDVDLYLEHAMMASNIGRGRYPDNYDWRPADEVAALRARVLDFAKILATCSGGNMRIYYNDEEVIGPLLRWYEERGWTSSVGPPMLHHNDLHRFHFHVRIAEDAAPLPSAPLNELIELGPPQTPLAPAIPRRR